MSAQHIPYKAGLTGAQSPTREPVLIVVANDHERRYFYSAIQAARGLGWLTWPDDTYVRRGEIAAGELHVYRLDVEATDTLNLEVQAAHQRGLKHDPSTGKWVKETLTKLQTLVQNCTGIKPA